MIKVRCHTNLDEYRCETWPEIMAEIPRIGDRVKAQSGKVLKVVGITHSYTNCMETPTVEIELNKKTISLE